VTDPLGALRIVCGLWFLPHCIGKIRNVRAASETFRKAGFRPAQTFVILTILLEVMAGTGLTFGIFPKVATSLALVVLLGAAYAVVKINGFHWRWHKLGPEYMIFWAIACFLSGWR
jgi:putative oxidoreductase